MPTFGGHAGTFNSHAGVAQFAERLFVNRWSASENKSAQKGPITSCLKTTEQRFVPQR